MPRSEGLAAFQARFTPAQTTMLRQAYLTATFGAAPAAVRPSFRVEAAADDRARVYVYNVIGGWDSDAQEFVQAVAAIDAGTIDLHINSPGGFLFDALAMFEALADHPARVEGHIDGLAASAASVIAMTADHLEIAKGGRVMIHDAQGLAIGGPADVREYADMLDAVSDDMSGYYADRAGGKPADWRTAMTATTWYSADQAVGAGLVDVVKRTADKGDKDGPDNRTRALMARARITLGG